MNSIMDQVLDTRPADSAIITPEAKQLLVHYFRFVDRMTHDDAMRKVDDIERYLERNT